MGKQSENRMATVRAFFRALIRDVGGNTLVITAAAMLPLAAMVGGGIDMSRLYMTKTRLQHACDAGALAGRKAMGSGVWQYDNYAARDRAEEFFDANFKSGSYGTNSRRRKFKEDAGTVTGIVSASVPMTLMRIFNQQAKTVEVTCDAEERLTNTDVMFVLDTTGSMNNSAPGDSGRKIDGLKVAVKCFYEIVARLNTDANCVGGNPSGGTGDRVQIRFGFVPYSTNVNVGKLLPTNYFADKWKYQSRAARWWVLDKHSSTEYPVSVSTTENQCSYNNAKLAGYIYANESFSDNDTRRIVDGQDAKNISWSGGTCSGTIVEYKKHYVLKENITPTASDEFKDWHYGQITQKVSALKDGSNWNSQFVLPVGDNGSNRTIQWDGCIEERDTVRRIDYSPIPAGAKDLDIDLEPDQSKSDTLWGPALPKLIWARGAPNYNSSYYLRYVKNKEVNTTATYYDHIPYYCPTEAKKLQEWPNASAFDNYVDSLTPKGNTYHDIGMLWGARLMSPTGIFASENATTPEGGEIQRNLIFMTDGDANSSPCDYTAYGVGFFDKRTTKDVGPAYKCRNTRGSFNNQVNKRLEALCTAVQNKNITLWVVSFGGGSNSQTEKRLKRCATSESYYFDARDSAALQQAFRDIANQISQLRLTK